MKIFTIGLIFQLTSFLSFSQSPSVSMKMGGSESERIGNIMKNEIDSSLSNAKRESKVLTSNHYRNGALTIYRINSEIIKMTKEYTTNNISYKEDYYFSGLWPLYVETKGNTSKNSNKYYFDKSNLMLWITENDEYLNVGDKNAGDRWFEILKDIDFLNKIAKMPDKAINEDEVIMPEAQPMSKSDSIELYKAIEEYNKMMKADSLTK